MCESSVPRQIYPHLRYSAFSKPTITVIVVEIVRDSLNVDFNQLCCSSSRRYDEVVVQSVPLYGL